MVSTVSLVPLTVETLNPPMVADKNLQFTLGLYVDVLSRIKEGCCSKTWLGLNVMLSVELPLKLSLPLIRNCTPLFIFISTPGSTFRMIPSESMVPPVMMYGELAFSQVVLVLIIPLMFVWEDTVRVNKRISGKRTDSIVKWMVLGFMTRGYLKQINAYQNALNANEQLGHLVL